MQVEQEGIGVGAKLSDDETARRAKADPRHRNHVILTAPPHSKKRIWTLEIADWDEVSHYITISVTGKPCM